MRLGLVLVGGTGQHYGCSHLYLSMLGLLPVPSHVLVVDPEGHAAGGRVTPLSKRLDRLVDALAPLTTITRYHPGESIRDDLTLVSLLGGTFERPPFDAVDAMVRATDALCANVAETVRPQKISVVTSKGEDGFGTDERHGRNGAYEPPDRSDSKGDTSAL